MYVLLFHEDGKPQSDLVAALERYHDIRPVAVSDTSAIDPAEVLLCVMAADLRKISTQASLRPRLAELGEGVPRIAILDEFDRHSFMAAYGLGAAEFLGRPVDLKALQGVLAKYANATVESSWQRLSPIQQSALKTSLKVFEDINKQAPLGERIDVASVGESAASIASATRHVGLDAWLNALRDYHRYTFRHTMFVTGTLAAAAQLLGFNSSDTEMLVGAGLVHDIGKVRVPLAILEKPGKLDEAEWVIMRRHPRDGFDILANSNWAPTTLDAVLHHHERPDGAGYPDRLADAQISDVARLVSIADVYSALVEKRSYKPRMSGEAAFGIMQTLEGQLDQALVKSFAPVALSVR